MHHKMLGIAAAALVAVSPVAVAAQSAEPLPARTGAEMDGANDLIRGHIALALVAVAGLILLLLELDDDEEDTPVSA